ncbi:hypothetical protein Esti_006127 [Eimeria stiedai]
MSSEPRQPQRYHISSPGGVPGVFGGLWEGDRKTHNKDASTSNTFPMAAHLVQWPAKANRAASAALRTSSCACGSISCKLSASASMPPAVAPREEAAGAARAAGRVDHTKSCQRTGLRGSRGFKSMRVLKPSLLSPTQGTRHFAVHGLKQVPWEGPPTLPAAAEKVGRTDAADDGLHDCLQRLWCFPPKPPHIPATVWNGILRGLHLSADNPIGITARLVESFFKHEAKRLLFDPLVHELPQTMQQQEQSNSHPGNQLQQDGPMPFVYLDSLNPLVSVRENFDSLLIEAAHCSRSTSDSYYLDPSFSLCRADLAAMRKRNKLAAGEEVSSSNEGSSRLLLRTHGTAHQAALLGWGVRRAVWSGAVARRDQVDPTHYPVFHQVDGIRIFEPKRSDAGDASDTLDVLHEQHAALLQAVQLATLMQKQEQQQTHQSGENLLHAFNQACTAAGLQDVSASTLCSYACFNDANPHRANPIVLQLQLTLERLRPAGVQTTQGLTPVPSCSDRRSQLSSGCATASSCDQQMESSINQPVLRWVYDARFPFTSPSMELEILHEGKWIELLGAGEIQRQIVVSAACAGKQEWKERYRELLRQLPLIKPLKPLTQEARGWAFGLGVERVAMLLFSIDDIRLLWSEDPRFTQQFRDERVKTFVPFSQMPPVYKDVSFWLPAKAEPDNSCEEKLRGNDSNREVQTRELAAGCFDVAQLYEICREEGGELIESVTLRDVFTHPITKRQSLCFRLTYKALDRTLTHQEVNAIQDKLVARLKEALAIEFR